MPGRPVGDTSCPLMASPAAGGGSPCPVNSGLLEGWPKRFAKRRDLPAVPVFRYALQQWISDGRAEWYHIPLLVIPGTPGNSQGP